VPSVVLHGRKRKWNLYYSLQ